MAHLHFTLNQEEIQELLLENRSEAFKKLLESALNSVLQAESEEQLSAGRYQRSDERTDYRNGCRDRELNTRIGRITLHVPRHRNVPFRTLVFENYSRSEAALIAGMAEMVVNGVSTRKVSKVMETLCGTSFSKSAVSDVCKDLSKEVSEFQRRPIEGDYPFVTVDATYFKVREDHRVTSKAARKIRDRIIDDYRDVAESAVACLDEGFESAMTVMTLPEHLRRFYRTSNNIERINKELKRRSKVIGVFPNAESLLNASLLSLHMQ